MAILYSFFIKNIDRHNRIMIGKKGFCINTPIVYQTLKKCDKLAIIKFFFSEIMACLF